MDAKVIQVVEGSLETRLEIIPFEIMRVTQVSCQEVPKTGGTLAWMLDNLGLTCDRQINRISPIGALFVFGWF